MRMAAELNARGFLSTKRSSKPSSLFSAKNVVDLVGEAGISA
jgi:hypothetical protein